MLFQMISRKCLRKEKPDVVGTGEGAPPLAMVTKQLSQAGGGMCGREILVDARPRFFCRHRQVSASNKSARTSKGTLAARVWFVPCYTL